MTKEERRKYYLKNRDRILARNRRSFNINREENLRKRRNSVKKQRATDPIFREKCRLRSLEYARSHRSEQKINHTIYYKKWHLAELMFSQLRNLYNKYEDPFGHVLKIKLMNQKSRASREQWAKKNRWRIRANQKKHGPKYRAKHKEKRKDPNFYAKYLEDSRRNYYKREYGQFASAAIINNQLIKTIKERTKWHNKN